MKQILSFITLCLFALPFANAQYTPPPMGIRNFSVKVQKTSAVFESGSQNVLIKFYKNTQNAPVLISNSNGVIVYNGLHNVAAGEVITVNGSTWQNDTYTVTVNFADGTFEKHRFNKIK